MDNEIKTTLVVETDTASLNKAKKAVQSLSDDLDRQIKEQERFAEMAKKVVRESASEMARLDSESKTTRARLANNIDLFTSQNGGLGKLEQGISSLAGLSDGLDVTDIIGAVDGVIDLQEGIRGLPSAFKGILSVASPLAIGLGAVALAMNKVLSEAQTQADAINARVDAIREANQFASTGGTVEGAKALIEAENAKLEGELKTLALLEKEYQNFLDNGGILTPVAQALFPNEEALFQQLEKSKSLVADYQETIGAYTNLVESGTLASEQLNTELERRAELTKESILLESEASQRTAEQNINRLAEIELQSKAIQAQIDVLSASTDTTAQIAELQKELELLGIESEITARYTRDNAQETERLAEAEKKATEEREKAQKALQDLNNKILDVAQKRADSEEDLARQLSDNQSDARRKLNADLKRLDKKARDETVKAVQSFQSNEAKIARDHQRTLTKIVEDANRQREELERNLDFSGLFDLESDTNQVLSDAETQFAIERDERQLAFNQQIGDLRLSIADERAVRNQAFKDELGDIQRNSERARRDKNIAFEREIRDATLAYERMYGTTKQGLNRINAEFERQFGRGAVATSGNGQPLPNIPTPSRGGIGFAPVSNNSLFSRSSSVVNNNAGGITFTVNGGNPADVERAVLNGIKKIFG